MLGRPPSPDYLFRQLLIHDIEVYEKQQVSDGQGGYKERYGLKAQFRGRVRPSSSRERMMAARWNALLTHVLYTMTDASIERGDQVIAEGRTYRVHSVQEPSLAGHHYEVNLEQIQQELTSKEKALFAVLAMSSSVKGSLD